MSDQNAPQGKKPVEDLSFGALLEEMGDVFPAREEVAVPTQSATGEAISFSEQERLREKREMEAKINAKVLGASGAVAPPMWIKGLFISGVAIVLLFTLANNATFQPIGAYATLIVALGAAAWNINGVMKDDETRDRALAAVGAVVALAVTALAAMRAFG